MLRSLCLTGPGPSPLSVSPRVAPLSLLFIQSAMRKRKLIFGWIHRIWRNCCFCSELSLFFGEFLLGSDLFVYSMFGFNCVTGLVEITDIKYSLYCRYSFSFFHVCIFYCKLLTLNRNLDGTNLRYGSLKAVFGCIGCI